PPRSTLFPYTTLFRSGDRVEIEDLQVRPEQRIRLELHGRRDFAALGVSPGVGALNRAAGHARVADLPAPLPDEVGHQDARDRLRSEEHTSELQSRENL